MSGVGKSALISLLILIITSAGCAGKKPHSAPGVDEYWTPEVREAEPEKGEPWWQEGIASWYGRKYHRRRTASGERYDMFALTAAHRTLPFGTVLKVTNLENGRTVNVRVNDRGPFVKGRIIDLSLAAARKIDMETAGIVRVRIEIINN